MMRIFRIEKDATFVEYVPQVFGEVHSEQTMESWLEANPESITEDGGLLLIGRQVSTNLGGFIDLLGVDRRGDVAVVELKRGKTPRETLAQALEYASFAERIDYDQLNTLYQTYTGDGGRTLADAHREQFSLRDDEAVSFNDSQHIVLVGSEIAASVRQTCEYLNAKRMRVTCLEFCYYQDAASSSLMSIAPVVSPDSRSSSSITTGSLPRTTRTDFMDGCNDAGRAVFAPVLALESVEFPLHWGSRGFSLNADTLAGHVNLCQGYPMRARAGQAKQGLTVMFSELDRKLDGAEELITSYRSMFLGTGLFRPSGSVGNLTFWIDAEPAPEQVRVIVDLLKRMGADVRQLASRMSA